MSHQSSSDEIATGADADGIGTVLQQMAAAIRPGWIVLHECAFGADGRNALARAQYALIHPHVGIALLDLLPRERTPFADRLCEALGAAGFPERFGGYPPVVHLHLAARSLASLGPRLDRAFDRRPPLALQGGDAWVGEACRVLGGHRPSVEAVGWAGLAGMGGGRSMPASPRQRDGSGLPVPSRRGGGMRALGIFWGVLLLVLGSGIALLQYLGPPESHPAGEPSRPVAADVRPAAKLEQARAVPEREDSQGPRAADPTPSLVALLKELSEPEPLAPVWASLAGPQAISVVSASAATGAREGSPAAATQTPQDPGGRSAGQGDDRRSGMEGQVAGSMAEIPSSSPHALAASAATQAPPGQEAARLAAPPAAAGPATLQPASPLTAQVASAMPALAPAMLETLMRRGHAMVALGDISAARLLYRLAAAAGSGQAAAALGRTYDPVFLAGIRADIPGDPAAAASWYRRAAALGDSGAQDWLASRGAGAAE